MSTLEFRDTQRADEISLRDYIQIRDDHGEWIQGKVTELALHGETYETILITLLVTDPPRLVRIRRLPGDSISYSLYGPEDTL
jgi:hypothetical protein